MQLANKGMGQTYPNPLVGSVIVYERMIIGEGWHRKPGEAHAEVNAINSVEDRSLLKKATIYVSLEPCSHFGKTPPCSDLIIAMGIKKVVVAMPDPFKEVRGRGIKKLMEAGCEVVVGVLDEQCSWLNRRFLTFHLKNRPYIILKWAQSEDDYIAPSTDREERKPVWISNKYSKRLVHKWRAEEQSILIGTNTAIADNPQLTTRLWEGNNPVRIILDRQGRIPVNSAVFSPGVKTIILTGVNGSDFGDRSKDLPNIIFREIDFSKEIGNQVCKVLYNEDIQSVIIEGGSRTLQTFIDENLWDEARIFTGKITIKKGIKAPEFSGKILSEEKIASDTLQIYSND